MHNQSDNHERRRREAGKHIYDWYHSNRRFFSSSHCFQIAYQLNFNNTRVLKRATGLQDLPAGHVLSSHVIATAPR
jgi:hypothetical protein